MTDIKIFGEVEETAIKQIQKCAEDERVLRAAIMADGHLGYSMPIGGVIEYENAISPTGVGFDIACGNMAVKTNIHINLLREEVKPIMRQIQKNVEFGMGRNNPDPIDHPLFYEHEEAWNFLPNKLKKLASNQLGTVGSGNHYVDLLVDESGSIWVANHFGSRGLGHHIASGFMALSAGREFSDRVPESEEPIVFDTDSQIGYDYINCMRLAGEYAYAGREYVIGQVMNILGAGYVQVVHNHHNYAWQTGYNKWVVRKGATPLNSSPAFIGGSMGDISVIVKGTHEIWPNNDPSHIRDIGNIDSAPHGAGRIMSRTKAAGKQRKMWTCTNRDCNWSARAAMNTSARAIFIDEEINKEFDTCPECGYNKFKKVRMRDKSTAAIDWDAVRADLTARGIVVLGAGADESPGVYKDLSTVLSYHPNIEIIHKLQPIGVVMAGPDTYDEYKD